MLGLLVGLLVLFGLLALLSLLDLLGLLDLIGLLALLRNDMRCLTWFVSLGKAWLESAWLGLAKQPR